MFSFLFCVRWRQRCLHARQLFAELFSLFFQHSFLVIIIVVVVIIVVIAHQLHVPVLLCRTVAHHRSRSMKHSLTRIVAMLLRFDFGWPVGQNQKLKKSFDFSNCCEINKTFFQGNWLINQIPSNEENKLCDDVSWFVPRYYYYMDALRCQSTAKCFRIDRTVPECVDVCVLLLFIESIEPNDEYIENI